MSNRPLPDRLLVISDVHLGQNDKLCIFSAGQALERFIRHHGEQPGAVELALLGDVVDYLQIEPALDFTQSRAIEKTAAILSANEGIFAALRDFVAGDGKQITWFIGNHDLELAFSEVRNAFAVALGNPGEKLQWRLDAMPERYELPGGGELHLVHGNDEDDWNRVDYSNLTAVAAGGGDLDAVYPPGSRLVERLINPLKKEGYRHIDLLKPEESVAIPLTLALWPMRTREALGTLGPQWAQMKYRASLRRAGELISGRRSTFGPGGEEAQRPSAEELMAAALMSIGDDADRLEDELVAWLKEPDAQSLVPSDSETFASALDVRGRLFRHMARQAAADSQHFDLYQPDDFHDRLQRSFAAGASVVVAGHTHLARAIEYAGGWYLNTGTWADLMQLPAHLDESDFRASTRALVDHLEHPESAPSYLRPFRRLTYVEVARTGSGAGYSARLRQWPEGDPSTLYTLP